MRNETCPICGKPTAQTQVIISDGGPRSQWLCNLHYTIYWAWTQVYRGLPTLAQINEFANGGTRPPEA